MRVAKYLIIVIWILATSIVLWTPRDMVRSTGAAVKRQPAIKIHKGTPVYNTVDDGDNWHLFWFFGLAGLTWALPLKPTLKTAIKLLVLLNLYSVATELIQEFLIPGRKFEWSDLLMNAIGIGAGLGAGYAAMWTWTRQVRRASAELRIGSQASATR